MVNYGNNIDILIPTNAIDDGIQTILNGVYLKKNNVCFALHESEKGAQLKLRCEPNIVKALVHTQFGQGYGMVYFKIFVTNYS